MSVSHFCFRPYLFVVLVQPAFAPQLFKFKSLPRDEETSSLPTIHKTNREKNMNKNSLVLFETKHLEAQEIWINNFQAVFILFF